MADLSLSGPVDSQPLGDAPEDSGGVSRGGASVVGEVVNPDPTYPATKTRGDEGVKNRITLVDKRRPQMVRRYSGCVSRTTRPSNERPRICKGRDRKSKWGEVTAGLLTQVGKVVWATAVSEQESATIKEVAMVSARIHAIEWLLTMANNCGAASRQHKASTSSGNCFRALCTS